MIQLVLHKPASALLAAGTRRAFHYSPVRREVYLSADAKTFLATTSAKDRITVVDFYADWCGPCHQLSRIFDGIFKDAKTGKDAQVTSGSGLPVDLVKIDSDSDEGRAIAAKYAVRALPTVIAFQNGEPILKFVGAQPDAGIRQFLQKV